MSNSYWHTPIKAVAGQNCSKEWRSKQNRRYRHHCKQKVRTGQYELPNYNGYFGNEWDSPRDGKYWIGDIRHRECPFYYDMYACHTLRCSEKYGHFCYKYYNELMRK